RAQHRGRRRDRGRHMSERREPGIPASSERVEAVERCLDAVAQWEPHVHAWAYLDPDRARAEARTADDGPLNGVVVGVKDIFDTADQPTEYGSQIYRGHRPRNDAGVVAQLRAARATVLGKTHPTQLAVLHPG